MLTSTFSTANLNFIKRDLAGTIIRANERKLRGFDTIEQDAAIAKLEAKIAIAEAVLTERRQVIVLLQNAFNAAQAEHEGITDALRTASTGEIAELKQEQRKTWAMMYALQEVRNQVTERGE